MLLDHADQLVAPVALRSGELDELVDATEYCSALGCAGDGDTATASELEQSFITEGAERA